MSMSTPELDYARTKALEEVVRLRRENASLRGAMAAQDERERKAAEELGMVWNCDWPDAVADLVEALRMNGDALWDVLDEVAHRLRGLNLYVLAERMEGAMGRVRR